MPAGRTSSQSGDRQPRNSRPPSQRIEERQSSQTLKNVITMKGKGVKPVENTQSQGKGTVNIQVQSKQTCGSRFQDLSKACKHCDKICIVSENSKENVQCIKCGVWIHKKCDSIDDQEIEEQVLLGTYACNDCRLKPDVHDGSTCSIEDQEMEESDSSSMNTEERLQAEFDGELLTNSRDTGITEPNVGDNHPMQMNVDYGAIPKTSSPKSTENPGLGTNIKNMEIKSQSVEDQNQDKLGSKLDEMMEMMKDIKEVKMDVNRLDASIRNISCQQNKFIQETNLQLSQMVQQSVTSAIGSLSANLENNIALKVQQNVVQQLGNDMDKKMAEKIKAEEFKTCQKLTALEQKVSQNFSQSIEQKVEQSLDNRIGDRIKNLEDNVENRIHNLEKNIMQRIEVRVEQEIENRGDLVVTYPKLNEALDEFGEKIWRRKNVLVCNLPESDKISIIDKKNDDLEKIIPIFNKFIPFNEKDIDGLPVRVGKVGAGPRMLRVTLWSEAKIRELVLKAREQNHLINPTETDNKKKLYINRDYTQLDRQLRKQRRLQNKAEDLFEEGDHPQGAKNRRTENTQMMQMHSSYANAVTSKIPNSQNQNPGQQAQMNTSIPYTINPQSSQFQIGTLGQMGVTNSLQAGQGGSIQYRTGGPFSQQDLGLKNKSFEIPSMEVNGKGPSFSDEQRPEMFGIMGGGDKHRSPMIRFGPNLESAGAVGGVPNSFPTSNSVSHTQMSMRGHAPQNYFGSYNAHETFSHDTRVYQQDARGRGRGNFRGYPRGGRPSRR